MVQISTKNQMVVDYSLHQNPTKTKNLILHVEQHKEMYDQLTEVQVAYAGYGSGENYRYLGQQKVEAYIKRIILIRNKKEIMHPNIPLHQRICTAIVVMMCICYGSAHEARGSQEEKQKPVYQ